MKLSELATGIEAHLKRFAADPKIAESQNIFGPKVKFYDEPYAHARGSRVMVRYHRQSCEAGLTKVEANAYLAWLDGGSVGFYWDMAKS